MRRITIFLVIILIAFSFVSEQTYAADKDELIVFCGADFNGLLKML